MTSSITSDEVSSILTIDHPLVTSGDSDSDQYTCRITVNDIDFDSLAVLKGFGEFLNFNCFKKQLNTQKRLFFNCY